MQKSHPRAVQGKSVPLHLSVWFRDSVAFSLISVRGENLKHCYAPRKWKTWSVLCGTAPDVDGQPSSGVLCHLPNK